MVLNERFIGKWPQNIHTFHTPVYNEKIRGPWTEPCGIPVKMVEGGVECDCRASVVLWLLANYLASQVIDPRIDSYQHKKDSWHIWRLLSKDIVSSSNLRCQLIFLHGRSRIYCVVSLQAGLVSRISPLLSTLLLSSTLLGAASNKSALFQILFKSKCE